MTDQVWFRTGWTCPCVVESFPYVELDLLRHGIIRESVTVFQWGFNPGGVAASAGAHDKGCMIDVGQYSDDALAIWRRWGYTIQHRTVAQGFSGPHGHGGPLGCTHGSPLAMQQQASWRNGRNGLRSNGPITGPGPKGRDTPNWKTALKENKVALLDDIQKAVKAGVLDALRQDDVVNIAESQLTGNPKNKGASVATVLDYLGRRAQATRNDVAAILKKP